MIVYYSLLRRFGYMDSIFKAADIFLTMDFQDFLTYYIFIVTIVIACLLISLTYCHVRMISKDETSIDFLLYEDSDDESHVKKSVCGILFDTESIENWKKFLGVRTPSGFIRRILLPSIHKPNGNGITNDDDTVDVGLPLYRKDSDGTTSHLSCASKFFQTISLSHSFQSCEFLLLSWQKRLGYRSRSLLTRRTNIL